MNGTALARLGARLEKRGLRIRNAGGATPIAHKRLSDAKPGDYGLFAVGRELWRNVNGTLRCVTADVVYVHAIDVVAARLEYFKVHDIHARWRICAIGPVVGFFVDDAHGDKLSV